MDKYKLKLLLALFCVVSILLGVLISGNCRAETIIHPTIEGTDSRDYSRPSIVIEDDGTGYQTIEGTDSRDYSKPGFVIEEQSDFGSFPTFKDFGND